MNSKGTGGEGDRDSPKSLTENDDIRKRKKKVVFFTLIKIGMIVLSLWLVFHFVFGIVQMEGIGMYPKILDGDVMLYYRLQNSYHKDDVVTFTLDGRRYTARIVASAGDVVELSESGELIVNGNTESEEIFYPTNELSNGVTYPYTVEEDSYFLLCDYRTASIDSRRYGAISKKDIDGKVVSIFRRRKI
jgi:signal peptidase I